jgi:hypothetical protein
MTFSAITCPGLKNRTVPETKNMTRIAHNISLHKDFPIFFLIINPPFENGFGEFLPWLHGRDAYRFFQYLYTQYLRRQLLKEKFFKMCDSLPTKCKLYNRRFSLLIGVI